VRALGVIQARGSSKRLPRKNLLPLNGHPLIAYMIGAAGQAGLDRAIVSTEDAQIAEVARREGADVPFRRPESLAADFAEDCDILLHAHDTVAEQEGRGYDIIVLLQPTTPFVLPETIANCVRIMKTTDANCCFAVRPVAEPPQWMFRSRDDGTVEPFLGRRLEGEIAHAQKVARPWYPTGAAYAARTAVLRRERALFVEPLRTVEMDPLRSIDIDEEIDLRLADMVAKWRGFNVFGR
jgi:CMP-N,N'-diacetyllegionaminic acid synthase